MYPVKRLPVSKRLRHVLCKLLGGHDYTAHLKHRLPNGRKIEVLKCRECGHLLVRT